MATLASYDFTGTNGTLPAGLTASGGTVGIQGNKLSILSPATAYSVATVIMSGVTAASDMEMLLSLSLNTGSKVEQYPVFALRCTSAAVWTSGASQGQPTTGYSVLMNSTNNTWSVVNNASGTNLSGALAFTFTAGTTYQLRFRCVGTQIAARLWDPAGAEPAAWGYNDTTATTTTAGQPMFVSGSGAAATATPVVMDDLAVTDGTTAAAGGGSSSYTVGTATTLSTARTATNTIPEHSSDHSTIAAAVNDVTTRLAGPVWPAMPMVLGANASTTSTTVADITGLLPIAVTAGSLWTFDFYGWWQDSATTSSGGLRLAIGGTATATRVLGATEISVAAGSLGVLSQVTAVNTLTAATTAGAATTPYLCRVHVSVLVNAAGTLGVRWGNGVATTTLTMLAGSYLMPNRVS